MKIIEVVSQTYFQKDSKHAIYTPYWIDPNNPAGRSNKSPISHDEPAPSSSDEPPPDPPLHKSSSRAATASHPMSWPSSSRASGVRSKKGGLRAFLAKGFNAMFSICHENFIRTAELERRTAELDENFRRHAASQPLLPARPYVPPSPMPESLDEWYRQTHGVPFYEPEQDISEEEPEAPEPFVYTGATQPPPSPPPPAPDMGTYIFGDPSTTQGGPWGDW